MTQIIDVREIPGDTGPKAEPCSAVTKGGKPCRARAVAGSQFCNFHGLSDAERLERARRGGRARSNQARAAKELDAASHDLGSLRAALFRALQSVESGNLEPSRASAMAGLARAILSVSEAGELEARLAAVESALERIRHDQ